MGSAKGVPSHRGALRHVTAEDLVRLSHTERLTQREIAQRFGVHQAAIAYRMRVLGVRARDAREERIRVLRTHCGAKNARWRGGRHLSHDGYVMLRQPGHPRADNRGYVREHIAVWEAANGCTAPHGWDVHHRNGDKQDNRPENLVAMPAREHKTVIAADKRHIAQLEERIHELATSANPRARGSAA